MTDHMNGLRILILTNYYPPSVKGGGYMQLCEEVAEGLAQRDHRIIVLTSTDRIDKADNHSYPVNRSLEIDPDWDSNIPITQQFFIGRRSREKRGIGHLQQAVSQYHPDFIFIWHGNGLPRVILQQAEQIEGIPAVYYLANYLPEIPDEYMEFWKGRSPGKYMQLFKPWLAKIAQRILSSEGKPVKLAFPNVICVSEFVKNRLVSQGLIPKTSVVIHNGIDLSLFSPKIDHSGWVSSNRIKCLIAGNLSPEKGIHTAINAFDLLNKQTLEEEVSLTIIGSGKAEYSQYLRSKRDADGLKDMVDFKPAIPRAQLPDVMDQYDIFLLTSEYDEPLARSIQEAMAMGLLVIGTTTGGSGELLVHEKTGLVFEPGDSQSLANQILRAIRSPEKIKHIKIAGQQAVNDNFDINHTINQIDQYLISLVR